MDSGSHDARRDSAAPADMTSDPESGGFASSIGTGFEACGTAERADEVAFKMEPERFTVFRFVGPSSCESLDRSVLLRNARTVPIRVVGLRFDKAGFFIKDLALPIVLQPGRAIAVPIRFRGLEIMEAGLTVATEVGCSVLPVQGITAEEGLFDFSAGALDFGEVRAGSLSEPLPVTFQVQFRDPMADENAGLKDLFFGANPEGVFEIVSGSPSPVHMESCTPIELEMRFRAPMATGPSSGTLSYELGPGFGLIDLHGWSIADSM